MDNHAAVNQHKSSRPTVRALQEREEKELKNRTDSNLNSPKQNTEKDDIRKIRNRKKLHTEPGKNVSVPEDSSDEVEEQECIVENISSGESSAASIETQKQEDADSPIELLLKITTPFPEMNDRKK
ncbi:hypothetical protein FQA39_LY00475 [Lamprigera yunnana]|nr:hypothetical protein FQA39_LY00475 [Lamprigera yunnana]